KQRLGIAAALLDRPELVVLDEPTNGLDPSGVVDVRELIEALAHDGTTVFLSSHILSEVEQVCDRVAILRAGRIVAEGDTQAMLLAIPLLAAAFFLLSFRSTDYGLYFNEAAERQSLLDQMAQEGLSQADAQSQVDDMLAQEKAGYEEELARQELIRASYAFP